MTQETKIEILDAMKTLIKDGESLTTENYTATNPDAFKEFAETNNFSIDDVVEVYNESENELSELFENY